uniref:Microtubule-actin cross-linking factor 1 n=1 Tax=Xenopus tropicalis TaxID=8364 RepID=A0A803JT26_XENTR
RHQCDPLLISLFPYSSPVGPSFLSQGLLQEIKLQDEKLSGLELVCSRLKDVSRKPEGDLTQSLVQSTRERLGKVQERAGERGRSLEEARKLAKQVATNTSGWASMYFSCSSHRNEDIKQQLLLHKEFQKVLRSKRPVYEATLRSGRALREKGRLPEDGQMLDEVLGQLRERWEHICTRSTERQHKLEESLLFSGKFIDALQALMDWLYRAEPQLSEEMPVGGDRDIVNDLLDKHKVFQKELGKRASCMKTLKHSVRDLSRGGISTDSHWLQRQMEELGHRWDLVCQLSVSKQARLEAALRQAEEFHSLVSSFLESLGESERTLKYGVIPEEEQALQDCRRQQQVKCIVSLGQEILVACHPNSVITIKSWLNITKTRYQEVMSWAHQQGERIKSQIQSLATEREEVTRLIDWITAAEEALSLRDQDPLPEDMAALEELISHHAVRTLLSLAFRSFYPLTLSGLGRAGNTPTTFHSSILDQQTSQTRARYLRYNELPRGTYCKCRNISDLCFQLQEFAHFDFAVWRKRYMQWIGQMKSRILDVFRGIDRDQDGRISQREFMDSVLSSSEFGGGYMGLLGANEYFGSDYSLKAKGILEKVSWGGLYGPTGGK